MAAIEVYDCERRARTISAIMYIRESCNLGLAAAKRLIDQVYYECRAITLEFPSLKAAQDFSAQMTSLGFSCRQIDAEK